MNDETKIQMKIDAAEKFLSTLFGNTSSMKMRKYALQMKIEKLKAQLIEVSQ